MQDDSRINSQILADADMESSEVSKFEDKRYQAQLAQQKSEAVAAEAFRKSEIQRKEILAQSETVDYHFTGEDIFQEDLMLNKEDGDDGEGSGDDADEGDAYPNISSSGGYTIKLGC
tara:strand:+ start:570 stop:920 length:351 start_codon:yes stop_codon:yes gene_type:complete